MALKEMHRQVGDLVLDTQGIAVRGLLVRHLVLPEGLSGTREAMHFLATEISKNTYVNIMDQYFPCGEVFTSDSPSARVSLGKSLRKPSKLQRRKAFPELIANSINFLTQEVLG